MPRHVREVNLATREARKRLRIAKKPYYRALDEGLHLGYRKSNAGSAWVVRWYTGKQAYKIANLEARPDDVLDADGATVLSWNQAQAAARSFFQKRQREADGLDEVQSGPYTVKGALADYMKDYELRGGKAAGRTQAAINALIIPALGEVQIGKLSRRRIEDWHEALAKTSPRLRTTPGEKQKFRAVGNAAEAQRRRRSSANRILSILKAALNHAHQARKVAGDDSWRSVKSFREVDAARVRYLDDADSRRLVNAAVLDFRPMVQAALLTGCRYGELTALLVRDYNRDANTLHIRVSKSGKPRHVVLTDEGREFFAALTAGKSADARLFVRADGGNWSTSHQHRPFKSACKNAKIGVITFHELRHTYASRLIMGGAPLAVVAAQLGHSDTRMVEKHYGHMAPSYVADTVRAAFGNIGIVQPTNIVSATGRK